MSQVVDALKGEGLDAKDIQTTNFSVQPLYEERKEGRPPRIIGYQVTNSVRLTLHDIGKLGQILDKVVSLGANDVGAIEFGVAEPEALKDEARKLAMSKAIANAKLYAEAAGGKLGKVLTISEDEGDATWPATPRPGADGGGKGRSHRGRHGHGRDAGPCQLRAGIAESVWQLGICEPLMRRATLQADTSAAYYLIQIKAEPTGNPLVLEP